MAPKFWTMGPKFSKNMPINVKFTFLKVWAPEQKPLVVFPVVGGKWFILVCCST